MIVLDTVALLYWTLDPQKLSPAARQAIEQADRIVVSSISIWEIALKAKLGKLELPLAAASYAAGLQQLERLEIHAVDVQTWLDNLALEWDHRDPADRTIVALANHLGCALVSSDRVILEYCRQAIW
jgi:PIN domain nuclease of toxin-antitoxin system